MADVLKKVPVREQDPKVRATNFEEVCYGYNQEEAMEEASRCINCKNAKCIQGCPVGINIPAFVHEVKEGNIEEAYKIIGQSSASCCLWTCMSSGITVRRKMYPWYQRRIYFYR